MLHSLTGWTALLLGSVLSVTLTPEASAQTLAFGFEGSITSPPVITPPTIWDGVQLGDPVRVVALVDTSTMGTGSGPTDYSGLISSVTIEIGGVSSTQFSGSSGRLFNDFGTAPNLFDAIELAVTSNSSDFNVCSFGADTGFLANPTLLASESLSTPIDETQANGGGFALFKNSGPGVATLNGTITSLTVSLAGDDCANAILLPGSFAVTPYDATGATTDGSDAFGICNYGNFGDEQNHNDIWFKYTPDVGGCTYISTFGLAGYDTRLTVYEGFGCPDDPMNIIACVDDEEQPPLNPFEAGLDVVLVAGNTYTIRLGTLSASTAAGAGSLRIAPGPGADVNSGGSNPGAPGCIAGPVNDECSDAIALPSSFADTPYDAAGATTDGADAAGFCNYGGPGDDQNHNDIWFTYTPDIGGCTYISTFGLAGYDTRLTVYDTTGCPDDPANIIACVDEESLPPLAPFEAGLDVDLAQGATYLIRLGTFDGATTPSSGTLRIAQGPVADAGSGGGNPGAPGCTTFEDSCNGDGGDQMGCTDCPCMNNAAPGTTGGCLNSSGNASRLIGSGDTSVSLPVNDVTDLRFEMTGGPPLAFCVLLSGNAIAPQNMSNPCFGLNAGILSLDRDGLRCIVQATRRQGGRSADSNGNVGITNAGWGGASGPPAGIAGAGPGFAAGQTRFFQVTHRDEPMAVCMRGLNTSQAVRVSFTP